MRNAQKVTETVEKWIRIRSWHIIGTWTRVPGRAVTLCGRTTEGDTADDPGIEKTCESCLRIFAKGV